MDDIVTNAGNTNVRIDQPGADDAGTDQGDEPDPGTGHNG